MRRNILFIDDQPEEAEILKNIFAGNSKYNLIFTSDQDEFFKIIRESEISIVFSDLHMPFKNGIELLRSIKEHYPHIIRVLFSNNLERNLSAEAAQVSHLTLLKPFQSEKIFEILDRTEILRKYVDDNILSTLINGMSELPTLPDTYMKLDQALAEESISLQRIAEIISHDISFTTKILKIVNSSFFGLAKQVTETIQAVNFLGRNILKSLMLFHQLSVKYTLDKNLQKYFEQLWLHGNKVGRFAKEVIHKTLGNEVEMMEDAYIAGLLHDIGKVVLLELKDYPAKVFTLMEDEHIRYSQAEYKLYQTSHAEVGAYFLALWGLPERIINAVFCHKKDIDPENTHFTFEKAVMIGNMLAHISDYDIQNLREIRLGANPGDWIRYIEELEEKSSL